MRWWQSAACLVALLIVNCQPRLPDAPIDLRFAATKSGLFANRCVKDVVRDVLALPSDPRSNQGYRSRETQQGSFDFGPAQSNHRQGIQRLHVAEGPKSGNYFLVSLSTRRGDPGFELVRVGELTDSGPLGNTLGKGRRTLPGHEVVRWIRHDNDYWKTNYNHAGGLQIMGRIVIVPLETSRAPRGEEPSRAGFRLWLVGPDPTRGGDLILRDSAAPNGSVKNAGSAGIARLEGGHYVVLLFGSHAAEVEVFLSTRPSLSFAEDEWVSMGAWPVSTPGETLSTVSTPWLGYQNTQMVTQCDGQLFLVASGRRRHQDWIHLWQLRFEDGYRPHFTEAARRHVKCNSSATGKRWQCSLKHGGGPYVDEAGRLTFYGVTGHSRTGEVGVREFSGSDP
jgi:hypothetical protein